MTERERLACVYGGETPDQVPLMLDLSHWFYQRHSIPFDLSVAHIEPEADLLDYHREVGAAFCLPNLVSYYDATFASDVVSSVVKEDSPKGPVIRWRLGTPGGTIERSRRWEQSSYSWVVDNWALSTAKDLEIFAEAMSGRRFSPHWERHRVWQDAADDIGFVYLSVGYSAMGHLLGYWMGIERVMYATVDMPEVMRGVVDAVNNNTLECVDMLCTSPAEVVIMGDNFSSDIQPPWFFDRWSRPYYEEAVARLHRAGKKVAVHVDGRLRGLLRCMDEIGMDCVDAVTPAPFGDITSAQCREEAGTRMILSGGVPPDLWYETVSEGRFRQAVVDWLDLRKTSPALILSAGDQVPPGASEDRIRLIRELADEHGGFS